jgi:hypothetical protein
MLIAHMSHVLATTLVGWTSSEDPWLIFRLSTGTGIFFAGLMIALVLLYGQTKDRWNWSKPLILLWNPFLGCCSLVASPFRGIKSKPVKLATAIFSIALPVVAVTLLTQWDTWIAKQPWWGEPAVPAVVKSKPSDWTYGGVGLGMRLDDLLVEIGAPENSYLGSSEHGRIVKEGIFAGATVFSYNSHRVPSSVYLKNSVVVAFEVTPDEIGNEKWQEWGNNELGRPSNSRELLAKFGNAFGDATDTGIAGNGLVRWNFFEQHALYCSITSGSLAIVGIYSPEVVEKR